MKNLNQSKTLRDVVHPVSHNQYCVKKETQHYIWGEAPQEETLVDRVCAGAAFLLCIAVLMFLG